MDIPTGLNIWIPKENLFECLTMALKMWVNECPKEVEGMKRYIKRKKDGLHKTNGMSVGGSWKEKLEIPHGLAARIRQMTERHDWMQDDAIIDGIIRLAPGLLCYEKKDNSRIVV